MDTGGTSPGNWTPCSDGVNFESAVGRKIIKAVLPGAISVGLLIFAASALSALDQTAMRKKAEAAHRLGVPTSQAKEAVASAANPGNGISSTAGSTNPAVAGGASAAVTHHRQWVQGVSRVYSIAEVKPATSLNACDLNADNTVNVLDVQAATNMNLGLAPCTAPSGFCTLAFVQAEENSALGQACSLPVVATNPTALSFGNVAVGTSVGQTLTMSISGTGSTTISQATTTGAGFSLSGLTLPLSLAAGQSANFKVTFAPAVTGTVSGKLSLVSNALDSPVNIPLSGAGVTSVSHSVTLTWTASTSSNVAGYNVYRGTVSGGPYSKLNSALVAGTSYTDTDVVAGSTYYYVATSVDTSKNESGYSNQAQATVPSP